MVSVQAQVPKQINYQAVIRDASGAPVTSQAISLKFSFYASASNGTVEYSETQSVTTNGFGLVSLQIGTGTPVSGTWDAIDWQGAVQYLGVAADLTGGSTYTELSNSKLSSVPYALQSAHSADNQWSIDGTDIINNNNGGVGIGAKPDLSAALDITANGKGLLIPRMKESELPTSPAEGLLVYQTDNIPGFYYYSIGQWHSMNGNPGAAAGGAIIPFASGSTPVALTTVAGGLAGTGSAIGFGSNAQNILIGNGAQIDPTGTNNNFAFVVPRTGTITSLSGSFTNTTAVSAIGSTLIITGQLYQSQDPMSNTFIPVPGATITLTPDFTGVVSIGQTAIGTQDGLNIPVTQGTRLMMVYFMTAQGLSLVQTLNGTISGGLNIQ